MKKTMKKLLAMGLSLTMVLSLAACGSKKNLSRNSLQRKNLRRKKKLRQKVKPKQKRPQRKQILLHQI